MLPLVLYDLPSKLPKKTFSHNSAKPRFVLSYKNLQFTTVWVEFPDVARKMKEIGASPTRRSAGKDHFTLPVLSDPNTGALVSDSWNIAEYLDETYPEKPIFPKGSMGLISVLPIAESTLQGASLRFNILRTLQILNEQSVEYFTTTREAFLGGKVDQWSQEGAMRDSHWALIEGSYLGVTNTWYDSVEGKWLMGDTFSYADIILAARLFWIRRVLLNDEWKRVASMHGGRWGKFLADVERECNSAGWSEVCTAKM